jgi:hypothetical protein
LRLFILVVAALKTKSAPSAAILRLGSSRPRSVGQWLRITSIDRPDRRDDLLTWMSEAGSGEKVVWARSDLAIISANCSVERGAS